MQQALLKLPATIAAVGLSRASIYALARTGHFPPPVRLGLRAVAWPSNEIEAYVAAKIRGASNDELRELVARLVAARASAGLNASAGV